MTRSAVVHSRERDSNAAGQDLGRQLIERLGGERPDAVITFISPVHDYGTVLRALDTHCRPGCLVGSSSAGEFTNGTQAEGSACALGLRSDEIRFTAGLGQDLSRSRAAAAQRLVTSFRGMQEPQYPYRAALIMTDALAGHAEDLIEQLLLTTAGTYQFFGGGAGDDARFQRTQVFCGTEVFADAVVGLEFLSLKPLGVGVGHGWEPASPPLRVTEAEGMSLRSLNGLPAGEVFAEHARRTGQRFDPAAPLPFFLHNILGIDTGHGYRLRVPLAVDAAGSVTCAAEIPSGAVVHVMKTSAHSAIEAAEAATRRAMEGLDGHAPQVALFFDCVATRLRMGDGFGFELQSVARLLGDAPMLGCNTHGQIARADGQFSGFHNCTAVVCVLPQ